MILERDPRQIKELLPFCNRYGISSGYEIQPIGLKLAKYIGGAT